MESATMMAGKDAAKPGVTKSVDFYLIFFASFILSLLCAIGVRFIPRPWRGVPRDGARHTSVIQEAKASAQTCVAFAFMG